MPRKGEADFDRGTFTAWIKDLEEPGARWHKVASRSDLKFEIGCGYAKSWNHERLLELYRVIAEGYGLVADRYLITLAGPEPVARKSRWRDRSEVGSLMAHPCTNL